MKEFQEMDFYQPPLTATMQGIEQQLRKASQSGNASTNGLLGRFLKLGKSKSDVHTSNYIKRRQAVTNSNGGDELEDDFVLAPVQLRGVEKMVHRANTKKDTVSKSHSWIYGSVKLPSDLPFGYGYDSNQHGSTTSINPGQNVTTANEDQFSTQRRRLSKGTDFFNCSCDDDYCNYITSGSTPQVPKPPCKACQAQLVPGSNLNGNRKFIPQLQLGLNQDYSKKANSIRKLTWKSLKQAVKKRPSLETLITGTKKPQPELVGSSGNYSTDDFLYTPTTNYFFPEKKNSNFYASCTDLVSIEPQHVTASVRLRPKRSRPTWNFPNEFGPVPHYATEDTGMYHSEWDLRQCAMPYEEWLTSTYSSSRQNVTGHQFLDDILASPVSSVKIQSYNNTQKKRVNKLDGLDGKTNGLSNNGTSNGMSITNGNPSLSKSSSSDLYTNGGVKRFSILHNETSAYQLNKEDDDDDDDDKESDELQNGSHLKSDDPVRIAGQGIFMVSGSSGSNKVTRSNSTSSTKYKNTTSFGTAKGNHPHHLLLSATRSEADGIWSDTQIEDEPFKNSQLEYYSKSQNDQKTSSDQKHVLKTFMQPSGAKQQGSDLQPDKNLKPKTNESKIQKNSGNSVPKKTIEVKSSSTSKRGSVDGENKYGALRRRRLRTTPGGGKTNLLREIIYEEESESPETTDEMHAVKIQICQNGPTATGDYVKPILKTRVTHNGDENHCQMDDIYDDTFSMSRSPRKVQFNNSREEIVISQSSSSSGSGTGESESNSDDDDESIRASDSVHHCDGNGLETKSGQSQKASQKQDIPIAMTLPSSLFHHTTLSRADELPPVVKIIKSTNRGVNNLEGNQAKQVSVLNQPVPIVQKNGVSFGSDKRKGSSDTPSNKDVRTGTSQGAFILDEKMILSKLKRMQNSKAERIGPSVPEDDKHSRSQPIINPNSLLFNDTTRIRLNQTRPSLESTFHLNGIAGQGGIAPPLPNGNFPSVRKVRPSHSFRSTGSTPITLRPKEPPPPPPRVSSAPGSPVYMPFPVQARPNKSSISLPMPNFGFSTTNDSVVDPSPAISHYQNTSSAIARKYKSKSLREKYDTLEKMLLSQHPLETNSTGVTLLKSNEASSVKTPNTKAEDNDFKPIDGHNIEIVTKENSVSEIRIYSGPKTEKPLPAPKNPNLIQTKRETYYASNDILQRSTETAQCPAPNSSRPQSTSVVLIIDTSSTDLTSNSIMTNQFPPSASYHSTDQPVSSSYSTNISGKAGNGVNLSSVVGQIGNKRDLLYDDVINSHTNHQLPSVSHNHNRDSSTPALPQKLDSISSCTSNGHEKKSNYHDVDSLQSLYSDVGMTVSINNLSDNEMFYDDTHSIDFRKPHEKHKVNDLPILVAHPSLSDVSSDTLVEDEPLYDDILNVSIPPAVDSDSGTETDVPPPLPTSGPPVHLLPEISLEIPVIPLPILPSLAKNSGKGSISKGTTRLFGEIIEFSKKISGRGTSGTAVVLEEGSDLGESSNSKVDLSVNHSKTLDQIVSQPPAVIPTENVINPRPSPHFQLNLPEELTLGPNSSQDDALLDRTRTLLHELNEKLANLNFSPEDYSISKVIISSSSDSSGVEEDYNSEKNYSLSNDDGSGGSSNASAEENYKLSKLVTETISMARGKFLDSMKITNGARGNGSVSGQHALVNQSRTFLANPGSDGDEPIYEEINDSNSSAGVLVKENGHGQGDEHGALLRSTSPIYADAFDAKSIFDGASRNEILSFLESIRDRLAAAEMTSGGIRQASLESIKEFRKNAEIARNDSGIGSEAGSALTLAIPSRPPLRLLVICQDCNESPVETNRPSGDLGSETFQNQFCCSCSRKRNERKEIVQEIYETELKYGRDLRIISDEFYTPIQTAGLLSKDQLDQIFLNVDQLIEVNVALSSSLKSAITAAIHSTTVDQDLNSVNVGRIFLEIGEKMMSAFEIYCTRQANAGALLTQIEKEKELLRIFLRVSQMENTVLRRMNLPAFLMVPVQRVTRYPLLLSRLLKVTTPEHPTREELELAQEKIETHLEHMNKTTREVASVKLWRRISIINGSGNGGSNGVSGPLPLNRRSNADFDAASVRIRKMALDILDWTSLKDVSCVIESQLNMVQYNNSKTLRHIYAVLFVRGKDLDRLALRMDQEIFFPPKDDVVKDVKLVLVRAKNARFSLLREPLCLSKCVISRGDAEFLDFIEINEITTKNTYYLQAVEKQGTSLWLKLLQSHAVCVGQWRRRRGALANIMMNGMLRHL